MAPEALAHVLRPLQGLFRAERFPALLVGLQVSDDAAVYKITDDVAVIQTLDFFTPVVDDAYDYGAIAAANAMSDVYAMGGEVALALNICGFPSTLPEETIAEILRGGAEQVLEAGGALAGGHTVDDEEPKYGLAVMGLVHPSRILTKGGARPGDLLALTKPLGVGIIVTAAKGDAADPAHVPPAVASMKRLNRDAARLAQRIGVHACTDITGFALLGHGYEMAERSGVRLRFHGDRLPFLDGAICYADEWFFPAGTCRNETYFGRQVNFADDISDEMRQLLFTPETSGGLLLAVAPNKADGLTAAFADAGQPIWIVGEVTTGQGVEVARRL
jgi:selenide, water dikinase